MHTVSMFHVKFISMGVGAARSFGLLPLVTCLVSQPAVSCEGSFGSFLVLNASPGEPAIKTADLV